MLSSILLVAMACLAPGPEPTPQPALHARAVGPSSAQLDALLEALRWVESGGHKNGGRGATGDGGRAIGPYQIHRSYFVDARVAGRYEDCRDPAFARRVVIAYWQRWCPEALALRDLELLARVHNGGPRGDRKSSTLGYWKKVERRLVARGV